MQAVKCDSKGRLFLKESLREKYGSRFVAIPAPGEILLIPVPDDAMRDLRDSTRKLRGLSMRRLKTGIEEAARGQVIG